MIEDILKEFDEKAIEDWLDADSHSNRLPAKFNFTDMELIGELLNPRIKYLITKEIQKAVREREAEIVEDINKKHIKNKDVEQFMCYNNEGNIRMQDGWNLCIREIIKEIK